MGFHYFNPHGAFGFKNFFCSDWHYGSWWGKHRPKKENKESTIEASLLGTFDSGLGEGSAEIVAHDADGGEPHRAQPAGRCGDVFASRPIDRRLGGLQMGQHLFADPGRHQGVSFAAQSL